jgi:hypothetical protein
MPSVLTHRQVVPGRVVFHLFNTTNITVHALNIRINKSNKVNLEKEKAFVSLFFKRDWFSTGNEVCQGRQ